MTYSEALELLKTAKSSIGRVESCHVGNITSEEQLQTLENVMQILLKFTYSPVLLQEAGWTELDLIILNKRLAYFRSQKLG